MPIEITWQQANEDYENNQTENLIEEKRLIKEIEESDFSMLDARDIDYYVNELNNITNRLNSNGKPELYTPNEIRRMNMNSKGLSSLDLLDTFLDDDGDFIMDFY